MNDRSGRATREITCRGGGYTGRFRGEMGRKERMGLEKTGRMTYQGGIRDRAHTVLEFPVEEIAEALILGQVLDFDLFQVATENTCIKSETVWPEPNREFERVDVSPQP